MLHRGVIRNPEKISYMLDTKFINLREFQIYGGMGDEWGRPEWGGGYVQHGAVHFFKIYAQIRNFIKKK